MTVNHLLSRALGLDTCERILTVRLAKQWHLEKKKKKKTKQIKKDCVTTSKLMCVARIAVKWNKKNNLASFTFTKAGVAVWPHTASFDKMNLRKCV